MASKLRLRRLEQNAGATGRCRACGRRPSEWPATVALCLGRPVPPALRGCAACRPALKVYLLPEEHYRRPEWDGLRPAGDAFRAGGQP
jgi:hypothetical protein